MVNTSVETMSIYTHTEETQNEILIKQDAVYPRTFIRNVPR